MNALAYQIDEYNRTRRKPGEPPMTQKRLAELACTDPALVSRHVHGQDMMLSTAIRYSRVLLCGLDDLVFVALDLPVLARSDAA